MRLSVKAQWLLLCRHLTKAPPSAPSISKTHVPAGGGAIRQDGDVSVSVGVSDASLWNGLAERVSQVCCFHPSHQVVLLTAANKLYVFYEGGGVCGAPPLLPPVAPDLQLQGLRLFHDPTRGCVSHLLCWDQPPPLSVPPPVA